MYEAGNSRFFSEIDPFPELKYASPTGEEPARKKLCSATDIRGIEHTQTSGAYERLLRDAAEEFITPREDTGPEDGFSPTTTLKSTSNGIISKQKKESNHQSGEAVLPPAEEVLGSVTTFYPGYPENGHTLRTSARVKHKMRMETIHNTPPPSERKEQSKASGTTLGKTPNNQKQMRVVWSNHDKNLFFEALNEYGKDFEAIQNYLNTKKRRKDNANEQQVFKTKDVRNLYYQFNQKISKYLLFSDEVKKEAQELYALINYGEMRKKVPFQNKKYFQKLKDLVYKGFTVVREKGKTIRIKTPSCRALRKLNQLQEWHEEIKLPPRVDVLLQPANMDAWGRVQSLAQNPRVRITVTIQKRVSALLQMFHQKWRPQEVRLLERVEKMKLSSANVTSKLVRQRLHNEISFCSQFMPLTAPPSPPSIAEAPKGQIEGSLMLHFVPSQSAIIHRPLISLAEFQSNTSICLNSYEQRIGVKVRGETLISSEKPAAGTCKSKSKSCHDVGQETTKEEKQMDDHMTKISFSEILKSLNASNESIELKDMDIIEVDLRNEHEARGSDYCDCSEMHAQDASCMTLDSTKALVAEHGCTTASLTPAQLSESSNDEFMLLKESGTTKYEKGTMEIQTIGELETSKCDATLTVTNQLTTTSVTTVTSTTTTTVRKKCARRKGSDASKAASSTGAVFHHLRPLISDQQMQQVREGWTLTNVNDLTVGDLYIMFGEDMKLPLEYDWVWEESTFPRVLSVSDGKVCPAANDEQEQTQSSSTLPLEVNEEPRTGMDFSLPTSNTNAAVEDGAFFGSNGCTTIKDEPSSTEAMHKEEVNVISKRLKQLLMLMSMGTKNAKKKSYCGNATERKPKRTDCDNNLTMNHDDSLLFKQPMLPARNGSNYMPSEQLYIPTQVRHRQSRWWRTRMNRQHVQYPEHLHSHPSSSSTSANRSPISVGVVPKRETSSHLSLTSTKDNSSPALQSSGETTASSGPTLHYEENANDIGAGQMFMHTTSEGDENGNFETSHTSSRTPSEEADSGIQIADGTPPSITATTCATNESQVPDAPAAPAAAHLAPTYDDSCLSLFDLSLPSTSSSLMANIFSTSGTDAAADAPLLLGQEGAESSALLNSPMKALDAALNDISLTSFFGKLDAVYHEDQEPCPHRPVGPVNEIDYDLAMSESSVDYIARFESIAAELRAQKNP